jgi:CzcA family heavy metal efflux pump
MIAALVRFSLRFPGVVIAAAALIALYGAITLTRVNLDVFPEFSPNVVTVQTEAAGLPAELVESQVTQRVETTLSGINGLETMRSQSIAGLSVVTMGFAERTDIYRDRQSVNERLALLAGRLPQGVGAPTMTPLTSSTSTVLGLGLTSSKRSLMELRTLVDFTVRPHLLSIPGVADVNVFGGQVRQWQVQVEPEKLVRHGLSLPEVMAAARAGSGVRGAGFIENQNQRIVIAADAQPAAVEDLGRVAVSHREGRTVTLGDVAQLRVAAAPSISSAAINGVPGVFMMVQAQYGSNIRAVTEAVEKALEDLKPLFEREGAELHPSLFRPANFVETAVGNIGNDVLIGAGLVVAVLFLFLFNARTALISVAAIPVSLLSAIIVLVHFGMGLNIMVLGGLAIAIGEVVDDAIIDMENIFRRLRENAASPDPRPAEQVVFDASIEVRGSVVYATFIVALVFYPLLTLTGVAGKLFAPLGIAYICAILASLAVAVTLTPAMCLLLLGKRRLEAAQPPLIGRLLPRYRRMLERVERRPRAVVAVLVIAVLIGVGALPLLSAEFVPALKEGHYIVHMTAAPGTSEPESLRIGQQVTKAILGVRGVKSVAQWVGRAPGGIDTAGPHYSEFEVELGALEGEEQERVLRDLRRKLADKDSGFTGLSFVINSFLTERIDETISGYAAAFIVNVYGPDFDRADRDAQGVAAALREVPGARDVQVQAPPGVPQLSIRLVRERLRRWGLTPLQVLEALQAAYEGAVVAQIYDGNQIINVAVVLSPEKRSDVLQVRRLQVRNPEGRLVSLSDIADIELTGGRYRILHDGGKKVQTITANVAGRDIGQFEADAKRRIESGVALQPGNYLSYAGTAQAQARARNDLILHSLIAAAGIFALLFFAFRNLRNLLLTFVNLPFALVGGVLAVVATGGSLSLGSLVGFVTLFGITLRNSIMLVSHYKHLVELEGMPWSSATAVQGAAERLPSILMTATVTALGLLPLALGSGEPGREIEGPLATVIVGGLISSTVLNLVLLPAILLHFGRFKGNV